MLKAITQDAVLRDRLDNMDVIPYEAKLHNRYISQWLASRDLKNNFANDLPEIGYITVDRNRPIAAGFIRRMEGNFAMLDSLITDPLAVAELRSKAIDLVVTKLIKEAKLLEIKHFFAFSKDANTIERSLKHGFMKLPDTVIGVDLSQLIIKEFI